MRANATAKSLPTAAPLFSALGDATRLRVVSRLAVEGPLSIAQLTQGAHVTRQAITKHLHVLANVGLVRGTRDGRENRWELEPCRLQDARHLLELISAEWDGALGRLQRFVERT